MPVYSCKPWAPAASRATSLLARSSSLRPQCSSRFPRSVPGLPGPTESACQSNVMGGSLTRAKVLRDAASVRREPLPILTQALGPLDFEHNPGFLVSRLARRLSAEIDMRMREHGLTFAQAAVMSRLWFQDGLTQSQLQEQVGVDASTLTGLLQRMTRQDLVRRHRDAADGRVLRVYLTPRGRALRPELTPEAEA